jgi:tetratricopeptide (TPR) repeat protein
MMYLAFAGLVLLAAVGAFFLFRSDAIARKALSLLERKRYAEAAAWLDRQPADPAHPEYLWFKAMALDGMGRVREALAALRQIPLTATRTNRWYSSLDILSRLAEWSEKNGDHYEAVKYLVLLRDKGFDTAKVRFLLGRNFFGMKDYAKSLHYLREALAKDRRMIEARLLMGRIFYESKQYPAAADEFKISAGRGARSPEAVVLLGFAYYRMDMFLPAAKAMKRVFPPPQAFRDEYAFCLGSALFHLGDFAGAWTNLERLTTAETSAGIPYKEVYYRLAVSAERIGKFREAVEYWEFLSSRDPKYLDTDYRRKLSMAYGRSDAFKVFLFAPMKRFKPFAGLLLREAGFRTVKMESSGDLMLDVVAERPGSEGEVEKAFFRFARTADPVDRKVVQICQMRMRDEQCRQTFVYSAGPLLQDGEREAAAWPITVKGFPEIVKEAEKIFPEFKKFG